VIRTTRFAFQRRGPKQLALRFAVNPLAGEWDAVEVRVDDSSGDRQRALLGVPSLDGLS
jgi:hypothetical protein